MTHDPHRPLENLNDPQTQAFVQNEHQRTLTWLTRQNDYETRQRDILTVLQDEKQIPFCQEHHARLYHFHQNADHPKGVYRVCSAASYRSGRPEWEIVFDAAAFDRFLGDDVWLDGVSHCVLAPHRTLLSLAPEGSDAAYTIEFDLQTRQAVPNGFHFPAAKSHIAWRDENSIWLCPAWDENQLTQSGYPRQVWLMQRGQNFEDATLLFETTADSVMVHAWRYLDAQGAPIDLIEEATGFFSKQYYQIDSENRVLPLALPSDADIVGYLAGQLIVMLKSPWTRGERQYPSGGLLAIKLNKGQLGAAQCLFTPNERQSIECVETTRQFIAATLLDNITGKLKAWRWHNGQWQAVENLPQLPQGALDITDQPWGGDILYLTGSDFLTPLTLYTLDLKRMELCVMRRQMPQFNPEGCHITQHHAPSADGTPIPYYRVGPAQADAPTLVYAYGGFGVCELPHYLGIVGRHWLAQGGVFVLANLRGGGEFGPQWHQAAQGAANKHKTVDDLLAVVQHLTEHHHTPAHRIALQGGSNGGLIVAAAYARQPQAIGALVCEVPLTDMLRYHQLYAGASWLEEYGNPDHPDDTGHLKALSPYHNLKADTAYPPALITTHLSDDRVHPAHALKFHARLKNLGAPSHLYAPQQGGHSGNSAQADTAAESAAIFCFLHHTIGQTTPNTQAT